MSRNRVALLTVNSLTTLPKVRSSRNSLDSIKSLAFVKNLSTATEISDFQNPDGFSGENNMEYPQNPLGFYSENQNHVEFRQKSNGQGQGQGQGHSHNWGYRGNNGEFQKNPIGHNGNFNGYYGENSVELYQRPSGYNAESVRTLQKSPNVQNPYGSKGPVEVQQNPNGFYQKRISESQQTVNGHCGGNTGQFRQSPSDYFAGNTGMSQQSPSNYYNGNTGTSQPSPGNHYTYSGMSQQIPGNYYTDNTGTHQQSPSGYHGINVGSPDGYLRGDVGEYRENPSGNYNANVGHCQQNSNESDNRMVGPHVSINSKPDGESVEASESGQYSGTIEELDGFCKEGKLKEAVEVLDLLEKQRIPVDLPRHLTLMKACGEAKALQEAKCVHQHLMRSLSPLQVSTYNKILVMYAKCGSMDDAYMVFHKMPQCNLTSWDTMITWLAKNGLGEDALELFSQFKEA